METRKAAKVAFLAAGSRTDRVFAGQLPSVAVWQPNPEVPEYNAAVVLHLCVGTTPSSAMTLLAKRLCEITGYVPKDEPEGGPSNG